MPKRFALRDVDPVAITICKQGANRQRIFLRKSTDTEDLLGLPAGEMPILKVKGAGDWSAFYCVVAQPGAEEDPGMTGERDSVDVWESESEIRKAAHRLLKNRAYVNAKHDDPAEPDCAIVESAIALSDIEVENPEGDPFTIRKDSWYVAIEPNDALREQIEAGEATGVSLEGTGQRVALEKEGEADRVSPAARKKLSGIIAKYRKAPHPFRACMRDNRNRFAKPEAVCGVLKKLAGRSGGKLKKADDEAWVDELIAAGVNDDNVDAFVEWCDGQREATEPLAKATATFAERIAVSDVRDSLWRGVSALESTIHDALNDEDLTAEQRHDLIAEAAQGFEAFLLGRLEDATSSEDKANRLAKEIGTVTDNDEEEPMGLAEDFAALKKQTEDELGEIKKSTDATTKAVEGLLALNEKLVDRIEAMGKPGEKVEPEGEVSVKKAVDLLGKLADRMDGIDSDLKKAADAIEKLGEGGTSQDEDDEERARLRKRQEKNPLAGLLA